MHCGNSIQVVARRRTFDASVGAVKGFRIIGGGMAAAGGILLGIDSQVRPEMGWLLLLPLFAAVILGTIGNPFGALVGAMVIGIAQQVSTLWLLPTYKPAVAFAILMLILLIRPTGIFGES